MAPPQRQPAATAAASTVAAAPAAEKTSEIIGDRELIFDPTDKTYTWADDGVVIDAAEREFLLSLDAGAEALNPLTLGRVQNPDLLFFKYEYKDLKTGKPIANAIRGYVLDIFRRPAFLDDDSTENEDGEDLTGRLRLMITVLLTKPTHVGLRGKVTRVANVGERVLMDLIHQTRNVVSIARPQRDDHGEVIRVAEFAWFGEHKEPFEYVIASGPKKGQKRTRQAWRGKLFGGFGAGAGFRALDADTVRTRFGAQSLTPAFLSEEMAARMVGVLPPLPAPVVESPLLLDVATATDGDASTTAPALPAATTVPALPAPGTEPTAPPVNAVSTAPQAASQAQPGA